MDTLYTVSEFADLIHVGVKTLQKWDREGILTSQRTPTNRRYYTDAQYQEYMLKGAKKPMSLWAELEANDKSGLFTSDDNTVYYPTGITVLDYANGYWSETIDQDGNSSYYANIGIPGGSMVSIISETGGGKTTLADQIAWNIIKPFEDGMVFHIDCEKTTIRQRVVNLMGCDYDEPRVKLNKSHTSIEEVLAMFNKVCDLKEAGKKQFMYEVKSKSYNGKPFMYYVPTVFIIDSLPAFNSQNYNTEDLGNNIDQMKASKDITRFYTNVLDRAWKYNVIFLVINHIRPNAQMNPYAAPPRGLMMINPQTETLPRGSVAQYFSSTYFRIRTKKSNAYTEKDDGFVGYRCEIQLAKTKSNVVGTSFPVTFNSARGFDPVYSIYEFADSLGLIQGRNPYLYLQGFEERKFNRKEWNTLMSVDESFRAGVLNVLRPYYEGLLGSKQIKPDEDIQLDSVNLWDLAEAA